MKREQEERQQLPWLGYCLPFTFEITSFAEVDSAEMHGFELVSLVVIKAAKPRTE